MPAETPAPPSAVALNETFEGSDGDLLDQYSRGVELVRASVAGMSRDQLEARPVEGKLSTLEVIGHVVDADQMMCERMKRTIGTDLPLIVGVENIRYPEPLHYQDRDLAVQIDLFEIGRVQMLGDLRRLAPEAWERTAVHTEVGLVTVRQLLIHAVRHVEGHLATIAEKRRALGID